ncbi:hypothetical protein [Acidisoma cladoniae]|uniref:hypothetical protein n=1 Tax=Acidisoma cladoniae TaxID=3040935 RepID=UPI002549DFCF|nr:hypothetical protein [Acidisoma sp. PAMC 29798]
MTSVTDESPSSKHKLATISSSGPAPQSSAPDASSMNLSMSKGEAAPGNMQLTHQLKRVGVCLTLEQTASIVTLNPPGLPFDHLPQAND